MSCDLEGAYGRALASIDTRAAILLARVRDDDRLGAETVRTATRHLREIRAEVDRSRLELLGPDAIAPDSVEIDPTEETSPGGSRSSESASADRAAICDGAIPMLIRTGPTATTVLGPDPIAYELLRGSPTDDDRDPPASGSDNTDGGDGDA